MPATSPSVFSKVAAPSLVALCLVSASTHARAQVTAPPLPSAPAHPGWAMPASSAKRPLPHAMEQVRRDAGQIAPAITHPEARRMLLGTSWLPVMDPILLYTSAGGLSVSDAQWQHLSPSLRSGLPWTAALHESYAVYYPRWNSPIWSVRAADVLLQSAAKDLAERAPSTKQASDPLQQPQLPTPDKPLRGQHLLVVQEDSFVLAYLLAGQGAHVTLVLRTSTPAIAALQTQPQWQGPVRGHGMGENVAPDGTLQTALAPQSEDARAWTRDPSIASMLAEQARLHGPVSATLVLEGDDAQAPDALLQQIAEVEALARAASSAPPQTNAPSVFAPRSPVLWYAMATTKPAADALSSIVQTAEPPATNDDAAMRAIAKALDWPAGDNPVTLEDVRAWWWRGDAFSAW